MELNLEKPLLFFDIESTGLNIVSDAIVELSFVKVFPDHHHEVKTWRVCPWDYSAGSGFLAERQRLGRLQFHQIRPPYAG